MAILRRITRHGHRINHLAEGRAGIGPNGKGTVRIEFGPAANPRDKRYDHLVIIEAPEVLRIIEALKGKLLADEVDGLHRHLQPNARERFLELAGQLLAE